MKWQALIPLFAFFISGFTGTLLVAQRRKHPVIYAYLIFLFFAMAWIFSDFLLWSNMGEKFTSFIFLFRRYFWGAIGFAFLNFSYVFLKRKKEVIYWGFLSVVATMYIIGATTDFLIENYTANSDGLTIKNGILFLPFVIAGIFAPTLTGIYLLIQRYFKAEYREEKQILILLILSAAIPTVIAITVHKIFTDILLIEYHFPLTSSICALQPVFILLVLFKYRFVSTTIQYTVKNVFANVTDAICTIDPLGNITEINKSAQKLFGLHEVKFWEHTIFEVIPSYQLERQYLNEKVKIQCQNEEKTAFLSEGIMKRTENGAHKILLIKDVTEIQRNTEMLEQKNVQLEEKVHQRTSEMHEMNHLLMDEITHREKYEKELQDQKSFLNEIINGIQEGIVKLDGCEKIVFCNIAFAKLFETEIDKIIGKTFFDFFNQSIYQLLRGKTEDGMKTEPTVFFLPCKVSGKQKYMATTISPRFDKRNTYIGAFSTLLDITEWKVAELALRKEKLLISSLMDNLPDAIYFKDLKSRFIRINHAHALLFGISDPTEAIGKTDSDFFAPKHAQQAFDDEQKIIKTGKPLIDFEEMETWPDGSETWVSTTKLPLYDENKNIIGTFGISRNITQAKRNAKELAAAKEAAETASQAKSLFLANMSHEIRTPMNGIIVLSEVILGSELNEEQHNHMMMLRNSAAQLLNLLNDILDFSKIEARQLDLELIDFDLREQIEAISDSIVTQIQSKNLMLNFYIQNEVPSKLLGDPARIRQVLLNLLGNAIKFTQQGEIILTVTVDKYIGEDVLLRFEVRDTGIGISQNRQNEIFDSFKQADNSTTRKYGGTGLGLAISKHLVELMGGSIGVQSEPGLGSTFYFAIPFKKQQLMKGESFELPPEIIGLRVLCVDEHATQRKILNEMLNSFQCKSEILESAEDVITTLKKNNYQLLISDSVVPEMINWELIRQIRMQSKFKNLPIIVLTAFGDSSALKELKKMKLVFPLEKPIKQSELFDKIINAVHEGRDNFKKRFKPRAINDVYFDKLKQFNGRITILIVEDNSVNQNVVQVLLNRAGIESTIANDGEEALQRVQERNFDLVLMDVQMPNMDGLTAARMIRQKLNLSELPILAMTANAMKGDREECIASGMNDYLSKPIEPHKFYRTLYTWLMGDETGHIETENSLNALNK